MDFDTVDRDFFICIDIELFRNQVFHGLDASDMELGVVGRCQGRSRQQCQHHGQCQQH